MYGIRLKLKQGSMYGLMDPASAAIGGSAILGYVGQQDAASAARSQGEANRAQSMEQWRKSDPFSAGGHREQYVGQLNQLMQGGVSGIVDDPSFKAMMSQGLQQSQRHASATGMAQSGNEQIALQQQGATMANDFFNQQYNRLASLSGASQGSSGPGNQISAENAYDMSMGTTRAMGGLLQGAAGLYGSGQGVPSGSSYTTGAMLSEQTSGFSPEDLASWGG